MHSFYPAYVLLLFGWWLQQLAVWYSSYVPRTTLSGVSYLCICHTHERIQQESFEMAVRAPLKQFALHSHCVTTLHFARSLDLFFNKNQDSRCFLS